MACATISLGRKDGCFQGHGGLKAIYIVGQDDQESYADFTITSGEITAFNSANINLYKYELHKTKQSNYEQSNNVDRAAGTSTFTQTINVVLRNQDKETQEELQKIANNLVGAITEDQNGNFLYFGFEGGLTLSITNASGTALVDANGYTLAFEGEEKQMAYYVDSTIIGDGTESTVVEGL